MKLHKKLLPISKNRNEIKNVLITQLFAFHDKFDKSYIQSNSSLIEDIRKSQEGSIGVRAGFVFLDGLNIATLKIYDNDASVGWNIINDIYSVMYWGFQIDEHHRQQKNISFEIANGLEQAQIFFHSLAMVNGHKDIAFWSAHIIANHIYKGGMLNGIGDANMDFVHFYWRLLIAQLHNQWVPKEKLNDALGNFKPLLEFANNPALFEKALIEYCDFRMARSLLYENQNVAKQRKPADGFYIFEIPSFSLLPLELFALKAVYESTTGKNLSLNVDHPLLQSPLMSVPKFNLVSNKVGADLEILGKQSFASNWSPLKITPLEF